MSAPRVSVCVPAYQAAANLQQTLDSVWSQDFEDFELVVVEDGSTDATWEILSAQTDPRLRLHRHERNQGQDATVAETVARARADLVKFLDSDDLLHRDCLGRMVAGLDANPGASFAFSPREILLEQPDDPASREWAEKIRAPHARWDRLEELNDGRRLLREYVEGMLNWNWIAEPAGVMARRADVIAVGGYNPRVRMCNDMDLWARLMTRGDVVFIEEPLYTYRLAFTGVTGRSARLEPHWLDPLWMAEGLTQMSDVPEPEALRASRRRLLAEATKRAALSPLREPGAASARIADLASYGRYRLGRRLGRARPLHGPIAA